MVEEILDRADDDWIQMSELAWVAMSIGGAQSEADVRDLSLDAIRLLLERGAVRLGDLRPVEGRAAQSVGQRTLPPEVTFDPWDLPVDAAIERVRREWIALGHPPNLGDIGWLDRSDREIEG